MITTITDTPYGSVSTVALEELRMSFDTTQLLQAVSRLDTLRATLLAPSGLRDELLRLHAMAHTVINGAGLSAERGSDTLTSLAQQLVLDLDEVDQAVEAIRDVVRELAALSPDVG